MWWMVDFNPGWMLEKNVYSVSDTGSAEKQKNPSIIPKRSGVYDLLVISSDALHH